MYLFGSRGITVALYALAVMLIIGLGVVLFRMMFAKGLNFSLCVSWTVLTALGMLVEVLYSELDVWQHHNGMLGAWLYLGMPFLTGLLWLICIGVFGRKGS